MERKLLRSISTILSQAACLLALCLLASCSHRHRLFTQSDRDLVRDSITRLTAAIARDISAKGPVVWLDYFDDAPGFFMATDGRLAFRDYPAARKFILDTLVKNIPAIHLHWTDLRIDPLSRRMAAIGAEFRETLTTSEGKVMNVGGYFTATAILTGQGWKLRNLHWSTKSPGN